MPNPVQMLKRNMPYAFVAMGVIWLVVVALTGLLLVLWPAVVFLVGGVLLKLYPDRKVTWAWGIASTVMGFVLSTYQAVSAATLVGGSFALSAGASLVVFGLLAIAHLVLLYVGFISRKD